MSDWKGARCLNCGAELFGGFCHRCGQEAVEPRLPLRRLVGEALGDLVSFDSRLVCTLRPLVARPGRLTEEWTAGRRVSFVPPLRLYVFIAALLFLVMAVTDATILTVSGPAADGAPDVPAPEATASDPGEAGAQVPPPDLLNRTGGALAAAWARDPERLQDRAIDRLGRLSLLLAPLSALLVALLYRSRRRFLVEHLVFTLHLHAFIFLLLTVVLLIPESGPAGRAARVVALAAMVLYLFLALRRVYGGPLWATALSTAAFALLYLLVVFMPTLFLTLAWLVWSP